MQTKWLPHEDCAVLLRLLTPQNALAMELALATGLRIGDVLALRTEQLRSQRITICQKKTGIKKRIYVNKQLLDRLRASAGSFWVFQHRTDPQKHKTRQAVWKDIKRASKAMRVKNIGCHSARKVYAVEIFRRSGLNAAQKALGHDRPETTLIYLASELCGNPEQKNGEKQPKKAYKKEKDGEK